MNEPEMNVAGGAAVDLHDARAGPGSLEGGIFGRFDSHGPTLPATSFEDNGDLVVVSPENGMNLWIAIDRQISILLRPIETGAFGGRHAVDGNDAFPGLRPGQRGRARFQNEEREEVVADAHQLEPKARLRLAAQLGDEVTETLFREEAEMRRRDVGEQFLGGGSLRPEIAGRFRSRAVFLDQGRELFLPEFFV